MRRFGLILALVAIGITVIVALLLPRLWPGEPLALLRARHAVLHDSLSIVLARDSLLSFAMRDTSAVAVALSEPLLANIIQDVAARYLDRVVLDLRTDIKEHDEGTLEVDTPLGHMRAGAWQVDVTVHTIAGVLAARKPEVRISDQNRIQIAIPAAVVNGRGTVTLNFKWDSRRAFNLICKDFETVQTVRGTVEPQEHVVRGEFVLSANEDGLVADPEFPREKFPLSMTLTPTSWDQIHRALVEQDELAKCGIMMNPDRVMKRLRALGLRGINVTLPRKIFRPVLIPAGITRSVRILDSPVRLTVEPGGLRIAGGFFWYGARIEARRSAGPDSLLPWPAGGK